MNDALKLALKEARKGGWNSALEKVKDNLNISIKCKEFKEYTEEQKYAIKDIIFWIKQRLEELKKE